MSSTTSNQKFINEMIFVLFILQTSSREIEKNETEDRALDKRVSFSTTNKKRSRNIR